MSINKNNYETFLIDYLDGKLTANEVSEVLLFLDRRKKENPIVLNNNNIAATLNKVLR